MKKLFTLLFVIGFCISTNSQYKGTFGRYYQKKDYKYVELSGFRSTDGAFAEGYQSNRPSLIIVKWDSEVTPSISITNAYTFEYTFNLSKEDIEEGESPSNNLEVFFIFKSDKKNKKWIVSDWGMGTKNEKYSDEKSDEIDYTYAYENFFFKEITNIDTGEKLDKVGVIKKIANTKEFIITIKDDFSDINICRFQGKKHKKKINKILSNKYKSIDGELLN